MCPLFGGPRDRALIKRVNRELLRKIIGVEVAIYKIATSEIKTNIYGESSSKVYYNPVRVHALVRRDATNMTLSDIGEMTSEKTISIAFLRDDLTEIDLVLEVSDIIVWDGGYYQVDNVKSSNHWWGRNPDTSIPIAEGDVGDHGYTISVVVDAHRTSISNLNLVETRSGNNSLNA